MAPDHHVKLVAYTENYRQGVLEVWSQSVKATHHFLSESDFQTTQKMLEELDFSVFELYCLKRNEQIIGFIGTYADKIEMLFIHPDYFGMGLGSSLIHFAIRKLKACKVDVNEQNTAAYRFYQKMGFIPFDRSEKDAQDMPYPIIHMELKSPLTTYIKSFFNNRLSLTTQP